MNIDYVLKALSIPNVTVKPTPLGIEVTFICSVCREKYSWKSMNPVKISGES